MAGTEELRERVALPLERWTDIARPVLGTPISTYEPLFTRLDGAKLGQNFGTDQALRASDFRRPVCPVFALKHERR